MCRSFVRVVLLHLLVLAGGLSTWGQVSQAVSPSQRDSLEELRRTLLAPSEVRPQYGYRDLDRLFRYAPPTPYDLDRGYEFLHAFAASQVRSRLDTTRRGGFLGRAIEVLGGKNFDFGKWQVGIDGVVDLFPEYNAIDGQWLGYELQLVRFLSAGRSIRLRSSLDYALRSKQWYTAHHLLLYYAPQLDGLLLLSGGRTSRETFHLTPGEIYRGYYASLAGGNSPVRDYAKTFLALRNRLSLTSQFDLSTGLLFEDRRPQAGRVGEAHRALLASAQLLWAPRFLNQTATGSPLPIGYRREFGLSYQQALDGSLLGDHTEPYVRYQQLEGFFRGAFLLGQGNKLHVKLSLGGFLDQTYMTRSDAKYFAPQRVVGRTLFRDSWSTLPRFYTGGNRWTTQEFTWSSDQLALSRTKGFGEVLRMDEALHARQLLTDDGRAFTELGYSLGWGELARFGLFGGYDWQERRGHVAFRISLPLLCLTSSWSERH